MKHLAGYVVVSLSVTLLASSPSLAKTKYNKWYSYAVPLTCGTSDGAEGGVVAGEYDTAVTVTNLDIRDIVARASLQLTSPDNRRSDRIRRNIRAGRSFLIDCARIFGGAVILPEPPVDLDVLAQGILTIESRRTLNVVVQNSASGAEGGISVQSRQILPRIIKRRRVRDDDVKICHIPPGNPDNRHTIAVDESSVPAHLRHGDFVGECDDDDVEHHDDYD